MGEKKASLALLRPFCELKKSRIVSETSQITLLKQIKRKQQANLTLMLLNNSLAWKTFLPIFNVYELDPNNVS